MSRLAWFTPWPPQHSGIAGRSAEAVSRLASRNHAIDVFVDERDPAFLAARRTFPSSAPSAGEIRVQSAHEFPWRQMQGQFDLVVYQVGNSRLHEFIWPYLFRWPGLVVLHDARVHHARAAALLRHGHIDDYRREFQWHHPELPVDAAELAVKGFDGAYYYQWSFIRGVLETARVVATHTRGTIDALREIAPSRRIEYLPLGEGIAADTVDEARRRFRARHGLTDTIVFGVSGALTAEKRIPQVLRAFAATHAGMPRVRLVLAGRSDPALRLDDEIRALGVSDAIVRLEAVTDAQFDEAIAAVDVSVHLRWPTAMETSGPWLRALSAARATIITDLAHQRHVPVLDPRTWHRHAPVEDLAPDADERAVAVAIDILDEDHSLGLAMRRLAIDAALRERLGREARRYWEREHTVPQMIDGYERLIAAAMNEPIAAIETPVYEAHRPMRLMHDLIEPFGVSRPELS